MTTRLTDVGSVDQQGMREESRMQDDRHLRQWVRVRRQENPRSITSESNRTISIMDSPQQEGRGLGGEEEEVGGDVDLFSGNPTDLLNPNRQSVRTF
jgi:hypothetical protein